jgi:diaminopimelate epimerase
MLPPASFALNQAFIADVEAYKNLGGVCFVDMLEPHLIIQEALMDEELLLIGRKLNQRVDVFPHGINVNAWHLLENGHLFVKTYERGVQRLTRSCGTGSVSCAAFCKSRGNMFVSTPGGELAITMHKEGIELKGPAFFFCKNKIRKEG